MHARPDRRPHGWSGPLALIAAMVLVALALVGARAVRTSGQPSAPRGGAPDRPAWSIDAPATIARAATPGRPAHGPWVLGTLLGAALGALALRWERLAWAVGAAPAPAGRPSVARRGRGPPSGAGRPI